MKELQYLSPTSIKIYKTDPNQFYLEYLADQRPQREPQNKPMSIGSAFDAYAKSYLFEKLFGKTDPRFELNTLLEAQVNEHLLDWARTNGKYVFEQYKQSGALADLMLLLEQSPSDPRFEFEVKGAVQGYREGIEGQFGEVVLLGKPDASFVTKEGVHCILDWKVNGYCSNYPKAPMPGYMRMRAAGKTNFGQHAKCRPMKVGDVFVNFGANLEHLNADWARQLAIYAWLTGSPIRSQFVTIVHQIVCSPNSLGLPGIRIAEHHSIVGPTFQQQVFDDAVHLWDLCHNGHFFDTMTAEESQARCAQMDKYVEVCESDDFFRSHLR